MRVGSSSSSASRPLEDTGSTVSRARTIRVSIALGEDVVERTVLEVEGQQAGEPLGGQARLLEEQRLAAAEADPLEVDDRRIGRNARASPATASPAGSMRAVTTRVAGSRPATLHLLGEAHRAGDVAVDSRLEDERPAAARALDPTLAHELAERVTDGDQAASVALRELTLGRHAVARTPFVGVERRLQVPEDLVMEWDWPALELESRHSVLVTALTDVCS